MMHVTQRVLGGISSLRTAPFRTELERLLEGARERGIQVVAWAIHVNHIHVCCIPRDARALADAMRYLFGRLARWINRVLCPGRLSQMGVRAPSTPADRQCRQSSPTGHRPDVRRLVRSRCSPTLAADWRGRALAPICDSLPGDGGGSSMTASSAGSSERPTTSSGASLMCSQIPCGRGWRRRSCGLTGRC
jgi:REP element-mobilizing transposase RayT